MSSEWDTQQHHDFTGEQRAAIFSQPLVFVDIETNGLSHIRGRVIEVAVIRVEQGEIVREFSTLVDPETELPQFITSLTGITTNDVKQAPTFHQIADELAEVMNGAVFVAHNVRFDYSFLKAEFARLNQKFLPRQLCTVRLSRALFAHESGHKLEQIISRYNLTYQQRHRARDDAHALWQFMQYINKHVPPPQIDTAVRRQLRQPAMPTQVSPAIVRQLPDGPGVYIFEDEAGRTLYVGKSIHIRQRVMEHFGRDHADSKEFKIAQAVTAVRAQETAGELAALLLEARLVKELQPVYNRQLRRLSSMILVRQQPNEAGYITAAYEDTPQVDPSQAASILAVYPRRGTAREAVADMARDFDLCPKLLGLEKARGACFARQLHKCRGACVGDESVLQYNQRLLTAFEHQRIHAWPYRGPVIVHERSVREDDTQHGIIVDQWCVIGEATQESYCEPRFTVTAARFDFDTYKILRSYFTHKLAHLRIHPLQSWQLNQLIVAPSLE